MDRLRILHVSEVHWGGVVTLLEHFTAEQVRAEHRVHVLAPTGMRTFSGVEHRTWRIDRGRPWTAASALRDLRRALREVRPDVVHLHSFVAGLLGRLPLRKALLDARVPIVYQPHSWSFDLFTRPSVRNAVRRWEARASSATDVLVANCDDEVAEGQAAGVDLPGRVLGVAVDIGRFRPVDPTGRETFRAELGLDTKHVLLCIGRLTHQKAQDLLVPAWERSRPSDTTLVLLGPGDTDDLQRLAPSQWGNSVVAVGEHADVRPWLWASDAMVLSSRYEGFPVAIAEAMACGRPVIATAINGASDTILGGPFQPAGAVVELGDMAGLIEQATRRIDDADLWAAECAAGRQRAEQLFSPGQVAERLEAAYREAIDVHREGTGSR